MANQDLNRLFENLHQAREVFVTEDGQLEDAPTAARNEQAEQAGALPPKGRTRLKPEVWGVELARPAVRVTLAALNAMHEEAARHPGESGGLLVGPDPFTVSEFIPSGPDAKRTKASYELDVGHLQPRLDEAQDRGLVFVGVFHSHPERHPALSALDVATARSIVTDPEWCARSLVLPLAVRYRGGFETVFYVISKRTPHPVQAELRLLAEAPAVAPKQNKSTPADTTLTAANDAAPGSAIEAPSENGATTPAVTRVGRWLTRRLRTRRRGVRVRLVQLLRGAQ